jgi:phage repressor protein C with HTH and peptisase S24 domain
MTSFGKLLRTARENNSLTTKQLAEKMGKKSHATILAWEKDTANISLDQIEKLSDILGLQPSYFLPKQEKTSESLTSDPTMSMTNVIPYYPEVNASAGLNFLSDPSKNYSVPISIPNIKADAFINVFGDSMYPKYCSGEIIGIKEIDKEMVMFGHAYVIQMSDGEAYLKYIKKGADDTHWLLVSENQHYEPREFHLKHIDKVFIIKAIISKTTLL